MNKPMNTPNIQANGEVSQTKALPFLVRKNGDVIIYDGETVAALPDDWVGICTDSRSVRSFWYIGWEDGERSFYKLLANSYEEAVAERARKGL